MRQTDGVLRHLSALNIFPLEATNLSGACQHSDTILSNEMLMH